MLPNHGCRNTADLVPGGSCFGVPKEDLQAPENLATSGYLARTRTRFSIQHLPSTTFDVRRSPLNGMLIIDLSLDLLYTAALGCIVLLSSTVQSLQLHLKADGGGIPSRINRV